MVGGLDDVVVVDEPGAAVGEAPEEPVDGEVEELGELEELAG